MEKFLLREAKQEDIRKIIPYIAEYSLDAENLDPEQFVVAEIDGNLAGFGRIKTYGDLHELASIGVVTEYRKNGVGEKLVKHLIEICPTEDVWITTKVADYFRRFGFQEVETIPHELVQKTKRVCESVCGSEEGTCYMCFRKE